MMHEKIRLARQAKGLTQEEMAEKLGLSLNGYGNIERGDTNIKLSRLIAILELLELDIAQLLSDQKNGGSTPTNHKAASGESHCTEEEKRSCALLLNAELDKQQLLCKLQEKEIEYQKLKIKHLEQINAMLQSTDKP